MKFSLRPTSASDLTALSQFLVRVFDVRPDAAFVNPAGMEWKYWGPREDWPGPRGYVLEKDSVIVSHVGIWPMTFGNGSTAVRGLQMLDWGSAREAPGAGLALCQRLSGMFDFIYSIGGSEATRRVLPAFGFRQCGTQWRAACPLRPVQQILHHQHRNWKLVPRLARNWLWSLQGSSPHPSWEAVEISPDQIPSESYLFDGTGAVFSPRPPAFFAYLLRCPVARFRLYGIFDAGQAKGHFALAVVRGQARVARVWLRQPTQDAWAAACFLARRIAYESEDADEVVVAGCGDVSGQGAVQAGFRPLPGPTVYLLDKGGKLNLSPDYQFQLGDDDAAFLDSGNTAYWA